MCCRQSPALEAGSSLTDPPRITIISSWVSSVQSLSCGGLFDPVNCNTPGFPVHYQLLELAQTHVHQVVTPSLWGPSINRLLRKITLYLPVLWIWVFRCWFFLNFYLCLLVVLTGHAPKHTHITGRSSWAGSGLRHQLGRKRNKQVVCVAT